MPKFGFKNFEIRHNGRRHDENHDRRHRQWNESPVVSENTTDHPRFPARFNALPWYRSNVPCMEACPVHTDSGRYVQLIAEGRFEDAFLIARAPNPLASVCGRVCSAPCEDACRRGWIDEAVTIRPLKRFVTERFGAESARPDFFKLLMSGPQKDSPAAADDAGCRRLWHADQLKGDNTLTGKRGHRVAVIGSGPAGLGCAHDLALMGYDVTVFEALPELGGMLRYGIPEYRLPRGVIDREIAAIEKLGVTFLTNKPITREFGLQQLREEGFEAFFLSVGAMRGRDLQIEGADKDGVVKAVDYLLNLNRGYRVDLGDRVVIIGGGSVALDAARTAVREFYQPMDEIELTAKAVANQPAMDAARGALRGGASEVHVISLESLDELPAARPSRAKTSSTKPSTREFGSTLGGDRGKSRGTGVSRASSSSGSRGSSTTRAVSTRHSTKAAPWLSQPTR